MNIEKDRPFYSVVQVAEILGISCDRLRTYDEENIAFPYRDARRKKRLYSTNDIEWLSNIRDMIAKNRMSLYSVKLILKLIENCDEKYLKSILSDFPEVTNNVLNLKTNPVYKTFLKEYK